MSEMRVSFHPSGRSVEVAPGTTLLEAITLARLPLGSSCRGEGACGWCRVRVLEGAEQLGPASSRELEVLRKNQAAPGERLACQARVRGAVVITTTYW